ncbi:MAG: hypothetical protein NC210_05190 [[Clostridium] fimetarium]|nr:nitrilase family protein [Alistipes timonensis]MCM1405802.1 hypothetical protein [[Clostridium] fimetarium]
MPDRLTSAPAAAKPDIIKIAAIPLDIRFADTEHNLLQAERAVRALDVDTDVAVLPELFSTSFIADKALMASKAEPEEGPTLTLVKKLAADTGIAIAGSYLASEGGEYLNRGFFVAPDGTVATYDKRHLFCLSPEARQCRAGSALPPVVTYKGVRFKLIICYDLRFPVWCRQNEEFDALLVPANWPNVRAYAWHHLLIARAIENQAVVVGADCSGTDDYGNYDGMTAIYDAMGKPLGLSTDNPAPTDAVYASFAPGSLRKLRASLPFLSDADSFDIEL